METSGAFSFNGTTLLDQSGLTESVWNLNGNTGLDSLLSTIRSSSRGAFKSELDPISTSDSQPNQTSDQTGVVSSAKVLKNNSFSEPRLGLTAAQSLSRQVEAAKIDSLTGTAESGPLVGAQAVTNVKVNFQPDNVPIPTGYIKDIGKSYQAQGSRTFGWIRQDSLGSATHVPLDITGNTRDRNRAGVTQRLDTIIHMQYGSSPAAAWEYALPDGRYSVNVSFGDAPNTNGVYDSTHKVNVEGVSIIPSFKGNSIHEYELDTVQVNVSDGRLTLNAIGGSNTKLNYVEIKSVSPGEHPSVAPDNLPTSRQPNVNRSTAVSLNVALVSAGKGVNADTLTTSNVRLYNTKTNSLVAAASIGTSGGGDAIVYQPAQALAANTHYTFTLSDGVKDEDGRAFLPFSTTFSTGTAVDGPPPGINFNKSTVFSGAGISSLVISPNNKLYAADVAGKLRRWTIGSSGALTNPQTLSLPQLAGRAIIGIAFDPANANVIWISHNNPLFPQPAEDFTGKISKLTLQSGAGFKASIQDYVVGLPRSAKDHLSNSLAFHNGKLYMTQGSSSATGEPDTAWDFREEHLLTAAVLEINPRRTAPAGGFNVQTETFGGKPGNYNPYADNAPVKIFATGTRNAYDLVWHSNGSLFVPTNGSAAGGNTPDNPNTPQDEGLTNVAVQNDYLFKVVKGGYYGHPNSKRQEYILNGGNPTSGQDPAQVVDQGIYNGYNVGTNPDPSYKGFAYDFGRNRSPNGVIEYTSNTFGGALKNKLLVAEYSAGDRILALTLNAQGKVTGAAPAYSGLTNPLDLIENTDNGNLYVAELLNEETGQGRISLLKPA